MSTQYIVSARKYRPQTFDTVVGQQHITTTLKNAIANEQLAHAYLFCGPRGVGKTSCARILARTINCESPTPDMEACGKCNTCLSIQENTSYNVFELDAASNNSVDDIRRLTEQVRYAPQHGKYKIYIIDEVHMLSTSAFNAFLKTLEEPPPYAIFILATTEKHKILPTILSRCQIFDFKRIQTADIVQHLASIAEREKMTSENAALHVIAQKSEGCMRDALSMMDRIAGFSGGQLTYTSVIEHLNILDAEVYFKLSDMLLSKDISSSLLYLDEILQKGFEGDLILNGFAEHFRNLLLSKDGKMARLIDLPEEHKRTYFDYAQLIPQTYILSALSLLNDAELGYKNSLNKRMHLELALIRLCYLNDLMETGDFSEQEGSEKKKSTKPPAVNTETQVKAPPQPEIKHSESGSDQLSKETERINSSETPVSYQLSKDENAASEDKKTKVKGPPKPKRTKDMLSQIQEEAASQVEAERLSLNEELAADLFRTFKEELKELSHELPALAHLEMMQIKCINDEEVQLVCNSKINAAYGQNKSGEFREYCSVRTGIKNLRVTLHLDESQMEDGPKDRVLSRLEVYDVMVNENPLLKELKDQLGLNIE